MLATLIIKLHFDAAHFIPGYDGDCSRVHGHRWNVDFELTGEVGADGMVMDFKVAKRLINPILPDHRLINDWWPGIIPTAENIAYTLYKKIEPGLHSLVSVTVWETEVCGARYPVK